MVEGEIGSKMLSGRNLEELENEVVKEVAKLKAENRYTGFPDIDTFLDECLETMRVKGHDYRQGNDSDLLHNFRTVGQAVDEDMAKVWFTYFYKHYSAMVTFIKEGGQSESEPIEGRIKDMIVYLLLFYRMVQERKTETVRHLGEIVQKAETADRNFKRLNELKKETLKQAEREMRALNAELAKKDETARKMTDEEVRELYEGSLGKGEK
jgi:hypothetical protein